MAEDLAPAQLREQHLILTDEGCLLDARACLAKVLISFLGRCHGEFLHFLLTLNRNVGIVACFFHERAFKIILKFEIISCLEDFTLALENQVDSILVDERTLLGQSKNLKGAHESNVFN